MRPHRSLLFTPGNHARRVAKVFSAGADAAILDLEDAVAVAEKPAARAAVVEALRAARGCLGYVRVNALETPFCFRDLTTVVGPWLDGVVLPKVQSPAELECADWLITQLEAEQGMAPGSVDLVPIIETGAGISKLREIARAGTRVRRMAFGAGDYTLDVAMTWSMDEWELDHARAAMVVESRAAGLEAPLDTVFVHIGAAHREALEASARRAHALGFQGKLCIHPEQVTVTNAVFTPDAASVAHARKVVAAFAAAEAAGSASIQVDGFFVDYPIVEKARRVLAVVDAIEARAL